MTRNKSRHKGSGRKPGALPADVDAPETGIAGYDIDSYQEIKREMASEPCLSRGADEEPRPPKTPRQDSEP